MNLIVGFGETGQGLGGLIKNFEVVEIDKQPKGKADVMHICIPPDDKFVEVVKNYIDKYKPELTIIHSSVIPGTTRKISDDVVYSPIRGRHLRMTEDLQHYTKFFGAVNKKKALEAERYFKMLGCKTKVFDNPEEPELFKLLDNLYYAWDVIFHDFIDECCAKYEASFDNWQIFNRVYNDEVVQVPGREQHHRSILTPPGKKIGGHCLWENAWLLSQDMKSPYLDLIINFDKEKYDRLVNI
jgi:UDP-N-acetyl-D-mannosaminuronate dehydrogenase